MNKRSHEWILLKKSGPNIEPYGTPTYFFPGTTFIANFSPLETT